MDKLENLDLEELELVEFEKETGGGHARYPFAGVRVHWAYYRGRLIGRLAFNVHACVLIGDAPFASVSFDSRYRVAAVKPSHSFDYNSYMLQHHYRKSGNTSSNVTVTLTSFLREHGIKEGWYRVATDGKGTLLFDPDNPINESEVGKS